MYQSKTILAIPPGATIREQLVMRGMKQKEFALRMDLSEKHISRLITGHVELTYEVALRLESVLGIPAQFWNNLEAIYREKIIRIQEEKSLEKEIELAKLFPYTKMISLAWVKKANHDIERVQNLRHYFEVARLSSLEELDIPGIPFRNLGQGQHVDYALAAWAQKARIEARSYRVSSINVEKLQSSIPKIRSMTLSSPQLVCDDLKTILGSCGIALVFLPHIKSSFLHGATFVDGNRIVMGLTVRGKGADKFWFSLFHEIHHILNGDIYGSSLEYDELENKADCFAQDSLVPNEAFNRLIQDNYNDRNTIIQFSKAIGIAPGIVVGRLQKENYLSYTSMNSLKEHYEIG